MIPGALLLLTGLALMIYGARRAIRHAVELSRILNLDRYGVGAGLVATVTSIPELAVAVVAVLEGAPSVAVGTAFGSAVGLLLFSMGFLSLIAPVSFPKERKRELIQALVIVTAVTAVAALAGTFSLLLGVALILLYIAYVRGLHGERLSVLSTGEKRQSALRVAAKAALSIMLVIVGAEIVTKAVTSLAEELGMSEFVIAFVAIALGTNLPEITLEATAALTGNVGIALGDILGSAVADLTLVLGVAAVAGALTGNPLTLDSRVPAVAGILIGAGVILLKAARDEKLTAWEGIGLILAYLLIVSLEIITVSGG